jgi:hypothetical protein
MNMSTSHPQPTLRLSELDPGLVYRCVLSGFLVLVEQQESEGPDPKDPRKTVRTKRKVGRYWNPVYAGIHLMELRDHQLMPASMPFVYGSPFPVQRPTEMP